MRKATLLALSLLLSAGAIVTAPPAAQAVGGGGTPGTPGCAWTCDCAGRLVCSCVPGVTGSCPYPPNIACSQGYNC